MLATASPNGKLQNWLSFLPAIYTEQEIRSNFQLYLNLQLNYYPKLI